MRVPLACLAVVALAASAAAQEEEDNASRIVRLQEEARAKQVSPVMGATSKAMGRIEDHAAASAAAPKHAGGGIPWTPILCVGGAMVAMAVGTSLWRWAGQTKR